MELYVEEQVAITNKKIYGTLTTPYKNKKEKFPIVLFFHGFGTNRNEFGGLFKKISRLLAENNIASLRMDFNGYNKNGVYDPNLTITSLLTEAKASLDFSVSLQAVDINKIGICGFSLGAGIAVITASKSKIPIKAMSLLSPSGDFNRDFIKAYKTSCFKMVSKGNEYCYINLEWRKVFIPKNFLWGLDGYNLMEEIKAFEKSLLLMAGEKDYTAAHVLNYFNNAGSKNKIKYLYKGANHVFNDHENMVSYLDPVAKQVAKWYKVEL